MTDQITPDHLKAEYERGVKAGLRRAAEICKATSDADSTVAGEAWIATRIYDAIERELGGADRG